LLAEGERRLETDQEHQGGELMNGSIDRRPDRPRQWRGRYSGPGGKQRSRSFKTKREAEGWLRDELGKLDPGYVGRPDEWDGPLRRSRRAMARRTRRDRTKDENRIPKPPPVPGASHVRQLPTPSHRSSLRENLNFGNGHQGPFPVSDTASPPGTARQPRPGRS
jgi:hypothetical protein